jgi:hypothetical protein
MSMESTEYSPVQSELSVVFQGVSVDSRLSDYQEKETGRQSRSTLSISQQEKGIRGAVEPPVRHQHAQSTSPEDSTSAILFRARLQIPGLPHHPEQQWVASFFGCAAIFENRPDNSWPKVQIEFASDQPIAEVGVDNLPKIVRQLRFSKLDARPSRDSVEAEVLYTRVIACADAAGNSSLTLNDGHILFSLRHEPISEEQRQQFLLRASLYRKLLYLGSVFSTEFPVPSYVPADDVRLVETIFDGVTKGVAVTRGDDITLHEVRGREFDLTKSPFTCPGPFKHCVALGGRWADLFGQRLDVGRVVLAMDTAEAADPRAVDLMVREPNKAISLRLLVYDHQIKHRFERYLRVPIKKRLARLNRFKRRLAAHEPPELVGLISKPLITDVGFDAALRIAKGWLYLNRFTERYCPQDPELDSSAGCWIVPIHLVYTDGAGGPVGELRIDVKTGKVLSHTQADEMQSRAIELAESIFHA